MQAWKKAECEAIEQALAKRLEEHLESGEQLEVSGGSAPDHVWARWILAGGVRGDRLELEAKVELIPKVRTEEQARDLALDALDLTVLEYFESERSLRYSGVFEERELRGKPVQVRVERTFPDLEAQADALLKGSRSSG